MSTTPDEKIVDGIIADIKSRSGIGNELESLPQSLQSEIREEWLGIAAAARAEGARVGEWVSVTDGLPEMSGMVLIYTEAGGTYVAHYKKQRNLFTAWGVQSVEITDLKTTHWRPLPAPPQTTSK